MTYLITQQQDTTTIKFLNKPTHDQILLIIDELVTMPPCEKRLWDLSEVKFDLTKEELISISDYSKKNINHPGRIALVAADDLAYGELRQFEVYREEDGKSLSAVFRNTEKALEWLNAP